MELPNYFERLINQEWRDLSVVITSRLLRSMLASRRFLAFIHKLAQLLPGQSNLLASFNFVVTPYVNNNNAKGQGLLPKVWKSYYYYEHSILHPHNGCKLCSIYYTHFFCNRVIKVIKSVALEIEITNVARTVFMLSIPYDR